VKINRLGFVYEFDFGGLSLYFDIYLIFIKKIKNNMINDRIICQSHLIFIYKNILVSLLSLGYIYYA
jgi:hypothetical protein